MKIHQLRHATFVIESNGKFILVDPMLGKKGSLPPFAFFRHKPRKNPTVEMPENAEEILNKVTHAIVTHIHPDHIDKEGFNFLKDKDIPVVCNILDEKKVIKKGLNVQSSLEYWKKEEFLGGSITGIPGQHGYGFIAKPAGIVMGFYIELPNEPSVYISSDTVYTQNVDKVLKEFKPYLSVVASGSAQFDFGQPLLMHPEDVLKFMQNSPNKVFANHMEAVNHCPTTRDSLREVIKNNALEDKVYVPEDGEMFEVN